LTLVSNNPSCSSQSKRFTSRGLLTILSLSLLLLPAEASVAKKHSKRTAPPFKATATAADSIVMQAMQKELNRSFAKLKDAGPAPVHFLCYRVYDKKEITITASYGGITTDPSLVHTRLLNVELRAGSPQLDSTHHNQHAGFAGMFRGPQPLPIEDDENALRAAMWNKTDSVFKAAQKSFNEAQSDKDVLVAEEDESNDFSVEKPKTYIGARQELAIDPERWQAILRRASEIYKRYPTITDSDVTLRANVIRRYIVTSEGTKIEDESVQYTLMTVASAIADDGMRVWLYDHAESPYLKDLPDEKKIDTMVDNLAKAVEQLRVAPVAEPYAGPVILQSKAAGVFFHEVFGHRAEGHRQKDEEEGRTFTKMIGQKIMPSFITVRDDPTCKQLAGLPLNSFYRYDDEGVPAQNVMLVDHGVLKTFLLSRSPVKGFSQSNGHGRSSPGADPVARQGNLIVESSNQVPYSKLREMLIAEIKRQGRPYGLVFDEIAGGFTLTQTWMPQLFKLLPLRVYRVYADGRPDELLRGVSMIGTPLVSLETIMCSADDYNTFNGNCGAESGWVPVSASAPSLLLRTLEVERQSKLQNKPPILPPPPKEAK
jgi:TldD protein